MDKIGRAGGLPYWKGDISASLPLVFTEALSYYQCIYLLYEKMNEIIETVNQLVDFYNAMENYLEMLYKNANRYYPKLNVEYLQRNYYYNTINNGSRLIKCSQFVETSEARSITVYYPVPVYPNTTEIPPNAVCNVQFMYNGTFRTETFTKEEGSHLILTTGNLVQCFLLINGNLHDFSPDGSIYNVPEDIGDMSIHPIVFAPYNYTVNITADVETVRLYNSISGAYQTLTVTDGKVNFYIPGGGQTFVLIMQLGEIRHRFEAFVLQGEPPLTYPDYYQYYLANNGDEIIYYNWDGFHSVTMNGQSVKVATPVLNYYNVTQKKFQCLEYTTTESQNPRDTDISFPISEYDPDYEAALAKARANLTAAPTT